MTQGGFLSSPRVRVLWGEINLSSYNGDQSFPKNTPVVYDIQVDLQSEGEGPTGSMKWDPTGPGGSLYEWFLNQEKYLKTQITVEYFYPRGKKIVFFFVWSGQSINYGNDMTIEVKLQSELAGLVNANQRSTAQAHDEKKGATPVTVVNNTLKQFGLDGYKNLVQYNPYTLEYWEKVKLASMYGNDWTVGNAISQVAKQTGSSTQAVNIGGPAIVVMSPWSWVNPKTKKQEEAANGATDITAGQSPDPKKRYGYILGPAIINTITRTSNWKPPQQDNSNNPGTQVRARDPKTGQFISQKPPANPQVVQSNQEQAAKKTSSPQGTSNGRANLSVQNVDNPYAPDRQNALNDEKGSELQVDTLMCPLLVGVKPNDILYIPNFTGEFIEDWIVQSVGYSQNNGQVNINMRATRVFGQGTPMNKTSADKFIAFAKEQRLVGPNATLEAWDKYAWSLPAASTSTATEFGTDPSVPSYSGPTLNTSGKITQGGVF